MSRYDTYLYDDCNVLINKLGIKDPDELDAYEDEIVTLAFVKLQKEDVIINSVFDVCKIHEILFEGIYEWAGEFRTISMYKSEPILDGKTIDYTPHEYIKKEMRDLELKFMLIKWDELSNAEKLERVVDICQELWQIHPFREGNTRSTEMFMYFLLKKLKINTNLYFIGRNASYFRNALVLASMYSKSKKEYLLGILEDSISFADEKKPIVTQSIQKIESLQKAIETGVIDLDSLLK